MDEYRLRKFTDATGKERIEAVPSDPDAGTLSAEERDASNRYRTALALESLAKSPLVRHPVASIAWGVFIGLVLFGAASFIAAMVISGDSPFR